MIDEDHTPTRARIAATMKWWGYQGVPDDLVRQIIRDINGAKAPMSTSTTVSHWPADCHTGIEEVIAEFVATFPGWWYSLGECQVSCDATIAPTSLSPDIALIVADSRFNHGFYADIPQPSTLADALRGVMQEARAAIVSAESEDIDALTGCADDQMFAAVPTDLLRRIADA